MCSYKKRYKLNLVKKNNHQKRIIKRYKLSSVGFLFLCKTEQKKICAITIKSINSKNYVNKNVYLKCCVTYFTSSASRPKASVVSSVTSVDVDSGRRSIKGLLKHHESSSSPLKFPGPNIQQLFTPSLST